MVIKRRLYDSNTAEFGVTAALYGIYLTAAIEFDAIDTIYGASESGCDVPAATYDEVYSYNKNDSIDTTMLVYGLNEAGFDRTGAVGHIQTTRVVLIEAYDIYTARVCVFAAQLCKDNNIDSNKDGLTALVCTVTDAVCGVKPLEFDVIGTTVSVCGSTGVIYDMELSGFDEVSLVLFTVD